MPRRRRSRVYWRGKRAWGDFRDYADVGGGLMKLVAGGETHATSDPDVTADVAAKLVAAFEERRRSRALLGVERQTTLGHYAEYHLVEKKRSGRVADLAGLGGGTPARGAGLLRHGPGPHSCPLW